MRLNINVNKALNMCNYKPIITNSCDTILTHDKVFIKSIFNEPFSSDKNTNIIMSLLSGLIYKHKDNSVLNNTCISWGLTSDNYTIYNIQDKLVFGVFIINKTIIIVFKGSSNIHDFLADIDFGDYSSPDDNILGEVHRGMHNILYSKMDGGELRCDVITDIISEYSDNYNIFLTGHSLGAGLATIFYQHLKNSVKNNIKIITFGSPRVGNKLFRNNIEESTRFVHKNDIVTKLPLNIMDYYHIPKKVHLNKESSFWKLKWWSIDDHKIDHYFLALL